MDIFIFNGEDDMPHKELFPLKSIFKYMQEGKEHMKRALGRFKRVAERKRGVFLDLLKKYFEVKIGSTEISCQLFHNT